MARKLATRLTLGTLGALLITLLFYFFQGFASPSSYVDATLESFLGDFAIEERMRMKVRDIRLGDESVWLLFVPPEAPEPSTVEFLIGKKNRKPLKINGPDGLRKLRQALDARQASQLKVSLEDDADHWFVRLLLTAKDYEAWTRSTVYINVQQPSCVEVRQIVYKRISSAVKERIQTRVSDKEIDLDEVFKLLLDEKIDQYLEKLDEAKENGECVKTIRLLKWIKGEEMKGFASGEYELVEPLQWTLDAALDVLAETRSNQDRYNLKVKVVGYTDARPVLDEFAPRHVLREEWTGVKDWSRVNKPLTVFHLGCDRDRVANPVYVPLDSGYGLRVKSTITDNCELGAVRAYVTAVYILNRLGRDGVEYSYATGGISPDAGENGSTDEPSERKTNVKFIINSATVGR